MNQPYTPEQLGLVANLLTHEGYQTLVACMKDQDSELIEDLADARTDADILARARIWQAYHRLVGFLAHEPERILRGIEATKAAEQLELYSELLDTAAHHPYSL